MAKTKISDNLTLDKIRQAIKEEVNVIISDQLKPVKADIADLKSDVGVLKSDVGVLKSDIADLTTRVKEMDEKYEARFERAFNDLDKVIGIGKKHEEEHGANLAAHDRFQEEIDHLKIAFAP